ncbi:hypothetical protein [Spirillospora sp. CA-294931]|uniref:hypothetical protein n=1 Tax=Spirillospora sp. CA-294931 TaxID=3240042 RepID=UPI003D89B1B8
MTLNMPGRLSKVDILPKSVGSLAHGLPPARANTLFVLGANGGMSVAPDIRFDLVFGRCEPEVHVCVGADDPHVSRRHGYITREDSRWVLHNVGKLAIRFPGSRLVLGGDRAELPVAYTPLFIVAPKREHLLEVRIAAGATAGGTAQHEVTTRNPDGWQLSDDEHLVLVCLSRRYLRQEPQPQPLTWAQVGQELAHLRPGEGWTAKRAAHIVTKVRERLAREHVAGLREEEIPPPLGNTLNHNLITELLVSATIVKDDLELLEES